MEYQFLGVLTRRDFEGEIFIININITYEGIKSEGWKWRGKRATHLQINNNKLLFTILKQLLKKTNEQKIS